MNNLRKQLTLAIVFLLSTMGLGTGIFAVAIRETQGTKEESELDSAEYSSSIDQQFLSANYCAKVTTQKAPLAVRKGPGEKFQVINTIPKGAKIRVAKKSKASSDRAGSQWLYIIRTELPGGDRPVEGWVSSKFIGSGFSCQGFGDAM